MEKYCPSCNKPNSLDSQFCRHCAQPLPANQSQNAGQAQGQSFGVGNQWSQQGSTGQAGFAGQGGANFASPSPGASGRAIGSLILTICALVLCCGPLTGIPGAILGWMEISAIREGRASPRGMMMAQIGLWGGIILSVITSIISVLWGGAMMMGGGTQGY
jgi:hypothetical protein